MIQFLNTSLVMTATSLLSLTCSSQKTSYSNEQRVAAGKNKKGKGPLIAIAGRADGTGYGSPLTHKQKHDAGELKHWPQWMQDYLRDNGGKVEIIATHSARWVKVSVVEGGRCAN